MPTTSAHQGTRDTSPSCRVVALTGMRRADIAEAIFSTGASGVLFRSDVASELFVATRTVRSGQRYLSLTVTRLPSATAGERSQSSMQLSLMWTGTCHHASLRGLVKEIGSEHE